MLVYSVFLIIPISLLPFSVQWGEGVWVQGGFIEQWIIAFWWSHSIDLLSENKPIIWYKTIIIASSCVLARAGTLNYVFSSLGFESGVNYGG